MICPQCKQAFADDARSCTHCGAAVQPDSGAAGSSTATNRPPGLIGRIKNILLTPRTEWPVIEAEATSIRQLYFGYVMPLTAFAAVMSFVHMSLIGVTMPFGGRAHTPISAGLIFAVVSFGVGLLGLYLVGLIINTLAPPFSGERNQRQAIKTAAYAFTPGWLGSILPLFGGVGTVLELVAGIYGIYLLHLGLPLLMKSPREKATGYTIAVVACTILLALAFGLLSAVTGGVGDFGAFVRSPSAR